MLDDLIFYYLQFIGNMSFNYSDIIILHAELINIYIDKCKTHITTPSCEF